MVLAHETLPAVRTMKWIAKDSPEPYGPKAIYRNVTVSLPFVVTMVMVMRMGDGLWSYTHANEAFFSLTPFEAKEKLLFPALLNVSKWPDPAAEQTALAWICTANYQFKPMKVGMEESKNLDLITRQLVENLLLAGFNYSSERHEGQSWYSETIKSEKRIGTIEKWEVLTKKDPMCGLKMNYLPTKMTVDEMAERMFFVGHNGLKGAAVGINSEAALAATLGAMKGKATK